MGRRCLGLLAALALLGGASDIAPGVARAALDATTASAPGDLPSSARPRAPAALV